MTAPDFESVGRDPRDYTPRGGALFYAVLLGITAFITAVAAGIRILIKIILT